MAQYFRGPVAESLGGTSVAGPETHDSLLANPALIPHAPEFDVGVFFEKRSFRTNERHTTTGIQMLDNSQGLLVPGGAAYFQRKSERPGADVFTDHVLVVGAGIFLHPVWTVGANLIRIEHVSDAKTYEQWDGTIGFMHTPRPWMGVGYALQSFTNPAQELPDFLKLYRQHVLGFSFLWNDFLRWRNDIRFQDEANPKRHWIFHSGIDSTIGQFWSVRLGYEWNNLTGETFATYGLGFKGPRLRINYAIKQLHGGDSAHSIDMRLPL